MKSRSSHPWPHHACILIGGQNPRPASPIKHTSANDDALAQGPTPGDVLLCYGYRKSISYFEEKHKITYMPFFTLFLLKRGEALPCSSPVCNAFIGQVATSALLSPMLPLAFRDSERSLH